MKLAVALSAFVFAASLTGAAAYAQPGPAARDAADGVGHRIAQTGRATGHGVADVGRGVGHAVAQTSRDTVHGVRHATRPRHHRRHRHHR